MRLLICTQAVDAGDPVLGFFTNWVKQLALRFDALEIICLRGSAQGLPENVRVHVLGDGNKLVRAVRLKRLAWRLRERYDAIFVHMNPEYLLVAGPLWKFLGKRISFWYNHPADNFRLRIAALLADQIFYTSPYAATAHFTHAQQMPVGIDTELFKPQLVARDRSALYIQGRVMPSKRVELALAALRILREDTPQATLTIVGPESEPYAGELKARFNDLVDTRAAVFRGPIRNEQTPALYSAHGVALNLAADGHFDKTAFEPMACETPAVVMSAAFVGIVPAEWIVSEENPAALASTLARLIALSDDEYRALGYAERTTVVREHGLASLIERLTSALQTT